MELARSSTTVGPGNTLAVTHGARSPRIVAERTAAIVEEWTDPEDGLPLQHPVDRHALWATAAAYARLEEMTVYLEGLDEKGQMRGAVDSRGRPRGLMRLYFSAYRETMNGLRQLGATPAGRAEMGRGFAEMHAWRAAQERLREAHQAHREASEPGDGTI
jgi:hypothetical protein